VVQGGELEFARLRNERIQASYLPHNFDPIEFVALRGEAEPVPGVRCLHTPGHVPWHQSILVESGGERACFLGDLVPTTHHLPLAWIMGYDVEPLRTLETRRAVYERALAEEWLLVFQHDPAVALGRLARAEKGVALVEPRTIA
jgi:glyoxylase-like metal-dependent hydrolase (beta-lactamase superfamily II)